MRLLLSIVGIKPDPQKEQSIRQAGRPQNKNKLNVWTIAMISSCRKAGDTNCYPLSKMSLAPMDSSGKICEHGCNVGSFLGAWPMAIKLRRSQAGEEGREFLALASVAI